MISTNNNENKTNNNNNGQQNINKPQTYRVIRLVGEGSFGKAYLVECNSDKVRYKIYYIK
jgi:hypothetical protein